MNNNLLLKQLTVILNSKLYTFERKNFPGVCPCNLALSMTYDDVYNVINNTNKLSIILYNGLL